MAGPVGRSGSVDGNTSGQPKRIAASKKWVFTWNNPPEGAVARFRDFVTARRPFFEKFVVQEEIGDETGTVHLQGCYELTKAAKKHRPKNYWIKAIGGDAGRIHWEKCKSIERSCEYCSKEETRKPDGDQFLYGWRKPEALRTIVEEDFYDWQTQLWGIIRQPVGPGDRTIHWYWESTGNVGKSAFARWCCIQHGAAYVGGKSRDAACCLATLAEGGQFPGIVFIDLPRSVEIDDHMCGFVEGLKNGLLFSGKYESKMIITNGCHVVIFANKSPPLDKWSVDRIHEVRIQGTLGVEQAWEVDSLPSGFFNGGQA